VDPLYRILSFEAVALACTITNVGDAVLSSGHQFGTQIHTVKRQPYVTFSSRKISGQSKQKIYIKKVLTSQIQ
jgi:hypothetical protein